MTNRMIGFGLGLLAILTAILVVCFLGGLASAALEVRRERKAGLVPTRPAWDNRDKRRSMGGMLNQLRASWSSARHPIPSCWCGRGPLAEFQALDAHTPAGMGCAGYELGDPVAIQRHTDAGGYARTPLRMDSRLRDGLAA